MSNDSQKFLIFTVATEYYGLSIRNVREIIRYETITPVRDSISHIVGVINLRGTIIPIMDFRIKLGMEKKEYDDKTVFIICEVMEETETFSIGLAVDAVYHVLDIGEEKIQQTAKIGLKLKKDYLQGIAKMDDKAVFILNANTTFVSEEIIGITEDQ